MIKCCDDTSCVCQDVKTYSSRVPRKQSGHSSGKLSFPSPVRKQSSREEDELDERETEDLLSLSPQVILSSHWSILLIFSAHWLILLILSSHFGQYS